MATKTVPKIETLEHSLDEVAEWSGRVLRTPRKLSQVKRESETYQDLFADLSVELDWLKMKAQVAAEAIDEYQDSLPGNDWYQPYRNLDEIERPRAPTGKG